jgi:predicted RNA binding protein YcfA (HicA-like mRNA interferase family)
MKYSKDRAIAAFVNLLLRQGWTYRMGGRHGKLTSPTGRRIAVPCTPSDHRTFQNFKRDIRKLAGGARSDNVRQG